MDWYKRPGCTLKRFARPLVVLRTKGPVDFVFDILDAEGNDVPDGAFAFPTFGNMTKMQFTEIIESLEKEKIFPIKMDADDGRTGQIYLRNRSEKGKRHYELPYNGNHSLPTQFTTLHVYTVDSGSRRFSP